MLGTVNCHNEKAVVTVPDAGSSEKNEKTKNKQGVHSKTFLTEPRNEAKTEDTVDAQKKSSTTENHKETNGPKDFKSCLINKISEKELSGPDDFSNETASVQIGEIDSGAIPDQTSMLSPMDVQNITTAVDSQTESDEKHPQKPDEQRHIPEFQMIEGLQSSTKTLGRELNMAQSKENSAATALGTKGDPLPEPGARSEISTGTENTHRPVAISNGFEDKDKGIPEGDASNGQKDFRAVLDKNSIGPKPVVVNHSVSDNNTKESSKDDTTDGSHMERILHRNDKSSAVQSATSGEVSDQTEGTEHLQSLRSQLPKEFQVQEVQLEQRGVESSERPSVSAAQAASRPDAAPGQSAGKPIDQILNHISSMAVSKNQHRISITLSPLHLGAVRMSFQQQGDEVVGLLEVQKPQTHQEIEENLPQLLSSMQSAGIQIRRIEVIQWESNQQAYKDDSSNSPDLFSKQELFQQSSKHSFGTDSTGGSRINNADPEDPVSEHKQLDHYGSGFEGQQTGLNLFV